MVYGLWGFGLQIQSLQLQDYGLQHFGVTVEFAALGDGKITPPFRVLFEGLSGL